MFRIEPSGDDQWMLGFHSKMHERQSDLSGPVAARFSRQKSRGYSKANEAKLALPIPV